MEKLADLFQGKWESLDIESRPNGFGGKNYLKRYFHNTESEASGTLVFYSNETGNQLSMTLSVIGPYHFGKASREVTGAIETDFEFTRFIVTPHDNTMVEMLNQNRPPNSKTNTWKLNETQTIDASIEEGIFGMVVGKYKEYDLVKIDNDLLYYGERPADGSAPTTMDKRATALQAPLKRVMAFSSKLH